MNPIPLHPLIVHFPLALALLMPFLALTLLWFIKKRTFTQNTWLLLIALQGVVVGTGYLAMELGERDEQVVERVTGKSAISEHESQAEMFVALALVSLTLLVITHVIHARYQFMVGLGATLVLVVTAALAVRAGESGAGLVYRQGAALGHMQAMASKSSSEQLKVEIAPVPTSGEVVDESEFDDPGAEDAEIDEDSVPKVED